VLASAIAGAVAGDGTSSWYKDKLVLRADRGEAVAPVSHNDWAASVEAAVVARVHCHGVPLELPVSREE
jgi:hypothetical protein